MIISKTIPIPITNGSIVYTGHGFAGTIADKGDVNVFQMYPKNSTTVTETHATLVRF